MLVNNQLSLYNFCPQRQKLKGCDEQLTATFDKISQHTQHFYYRRYDIKCQSTEMLKNGTGFSILEYNGAGTGIQLVYGSGLSLWQACRLILLH